MTRRVIVMCLITTVLAVAGTSKASITDRPEYRPSTDLTLGVVGTGYNGDQGFTITQDFQINLTYEPGQTAEEMAAVDAFNDYNYPGGLNFNDEEWYFLRIDIAGNLNATEYDEGNTLGGAVTNTGFQWTLTGWNQTIFAGNIVDLGGSIFLEVDPTRGYRPFPGDLMVNSVEVFDGIVPSEVLGYTFAGSASEIGPGSVLNVQTIPEPTSLIIWSFLGAGCAGVAVVRYRRRNSWK